MMLKYESTKPRRPLSRLSQNKLLHLLAFEQPFQVYYARSAHM